MIRCQWASDESMHDYHDLEWGVPVHNDRTLFEFLTLEGAQAGLSWSTILKKRDGYRQAFHNFDIERVAKIRRPTVEKLLKDPSIVRNRLKVESTVSNAKAALEVIEEFGSLDAHFWAFVDGKPVRNSWKVLEETPTSTPTSDALSRDLKKRGFRFVGTTICYAFMQAVGMVNDHTTDCFRYRQL